jgi:hypothetical protein
MTVRRTLLVLFILLGLSPPLRAELFEHSSAGYRVEIPAGWRSRVVGGALLCSASRGLRVRVEYELSPRPLDTAGVADFFRADGHRLKEAYGAVKIRQRPELSETWRLGDKESFTYFLLYRPRPRSLGLARGVVTTGSSLWPGKELWIKVLLYGGRKSLKANKGAIKAFLASFGWPGPAGEPSPPTPDPLPVVSRPPPALPTQMAVVATEDMAPVAEIVAPTGGRELGSSGGFHRGSRRGGSAMFRGAFVSQNQEWDRRINEAWAPTDRHRTRAQQEASAARMGFKMEE